MVIFNRSSIISNACLSFNNQVAVFVYFNNLTMSFNIGNGRQIFTNPTKLLLLLLPTYYDDPSDDEDLIVFE